MTTSRELLADIRAEFFTGGPAQPIDSEAVADAFARAISKVAADDFYCLMAGGALTTRYEGIDGLRLGWRDFLGAFDTVTIAPGEIFDSPDGLLEFVHLSGRPSGVDAEIEQDGAAVWRVRDAKVVCVEFHLDRGQARESAGLAE